MRRSNPLTAILCIAAFGAAPLFAQDKKAEPAKPGDTKPPVAAPDAKASADKAAQAAPPQMSEEQKQMMAAWEAAKTVGEHHKGLAKLAGEFTYSQKMWMGGEQPMESTGTTSRRLVMGGRYLISEHKGTFMGEPFEGMAIEGYDNLHKRYIASWIDNLGTGIMLSEGKFDAASKTYEYTGEIDDPMTGKKSKVRYTFRVESENKQVFEWFETHEGKEQRTIEVIYTRQG